MSIKLHITTWKKLIEALIPTTTISPQWPSYDDFITNIYEKSNYFRVRKKIICLSTIIICM